MTELDFRVLIAMYLNQTTREDELMNIARIKMCEKCGHYDLEEDMEKEKQVSDELWYCKKCWKNREFV